MDIDPLKTNGRIDTPGGNLPPDIGTSDLSRTLPRQISTGTMRGTQSVGYGTTKIDGSNNRITIGAPDGSSVGMGAIPNSTTGEYGFFSLDATGKLIFKIVNGTLYMYDGSSGINRVQFGKLPDNTYDMVISKTGTDVGTLFT